MSDRCKKCIHENVCHAVAECINLFDDFKCNDYEEKRPHGEWIKSDNKYKGEWKCSVCEKYASFYNNPYKDKSDFCPNCGADMRKEGDVE